MVKRNAAVTPKTVDPPGAADPHEAWHELAVVAVERLVVRTWAERDGDGADGDRPPDPLARDEELAAARRAFRAVLHQPTPITVVAARAGLTPTETEVLAIAVGIELDERLQRLLVHVHADAARPGLEVGDLEHLLGDLGDLGGNDGNHGNDGTGADTGDPQLTLGPGSGLRRAGLVSVSAKGPFSRQAVVVHPSVVWALLSDPSPDPDLPPGWKLLHRHELPPANLLQIVGEAGEDPHRSLLVLGTDRVRRRQTAMALTQGDRFLVSDQPADAAGWAALVREATLLGAALVIELDRPLEDFGRSWIEQALHLPVAVTTALPPALDRLPGRTWREVECITAEPSADEWADALGPDAPRLHRLSATQLELVASARRARQGDLDAAVRRLVSGNLDRLARRIRPRRTWSDMVLPPVRLAQLQELVDRYRHSAQVFDDWGLSATPSRGIVALFSGPSGTGKTMAAEVIAGALGLDLFKLELSAVVSKYIGETEKHLDELFDAASAGNMVLFFDEADALFGKRSEVKDARDRYANIEVSYLLQRIESFDGVVVLATNFEKNIDQAFLRRIHTRIDFVIPSAAEREAIWRQQFPATAPVEDVDFADLAQRFELAGGSIRNAAVHAAFLAATENTGITMSTIVRALAREYRKLGRLLKPEEFGPYLAEVTADVVADAPAGTGAGK